MQPLMLSATAFQLYGIFAALALAAVAAAFLIARVVWTRRRHKRPIAIPEYAIQHTWWGRLKSLLWRILAAVAGFLIMRWLLLDGHADHVIQRAKEAIAMVVDALSKLLPMVS
jgi:hypothetical protein